MIRRQFLKVTAGTLASNALSAFASREKSEGAQGPLNAAAYHATRKYAETNFGRIAYVERGKGPAAIFLHGYPLNGFQWRGALQKLAPYRRCIAFDFMGLGYTETPETQDLSPRAQADMLARFLAVLGIDSADVVANDSGGAVAQLFLAKYPQKVRTLLLTNCDVHENSPPVALADFLELARAGLAADQWLLPQLKDPNFARSEKGLGGGAYTDPNNLTDESIDYYFSPLVSSPLRKKQFNDYGVKFEPNPLISIEPALRRSQAPVRMVWGTGDRLFPISWAEWLDHTFPNSRGIRRVEGAKLFFPEEMPELIAEEAKQLWS
jgi:haloalkane dehalogenase